MERINLEILSSFDLIITTSVMQSDNESMSVVQTLSRTEREYSQMLVQAIGILLGYRRYTVGILLVRPRKTVLVFPNSWSKAITLTMTKVHW